MQTSTIIKLFLISISLFLSLWCKSQNGTISNEDLRNTTDTSYESVNNGHGKEIEAIFIIKNWGRVYDPISINLLKLTNIDRMTTGKTRRGLKMVGSITIYLKEGVQLVSLKELFNRYNVSKEYRKGVPIQIENKLMKRPRKLLFDPSQNFRIDINENPADTSFNTRQYIKIYISK
jgi:hypothetical protein